MQILTTFIAVAAMMLWPFFTAIVAQTFGRKFWPWFTLGLVLPLISLVLLHCIPPKGRKYRSDGFPPGNTPYHWKR